MRPTPATHTLAQPDLDGCPVGFLYRGRNLDSSTEATYFAGMEAPLNHPKWQQETYFHVIEAEEGKVLEHRMKGEGTIVTVERDLADYQVEAHVRQFVPGAWPNMDDEYCNVARNGLVFHMHDLRRYYQLCLEGFDRVVLVRRRDYDRAVLGELRFPLDPTRYHHLVAQVEGNRIRCWSDGDLVADVCDVSYPAGAAGIRVNSICRIRNLRVATWEEGRRANAARLTDKERDLAQAREGQPMPALWRQYDLKRTGRAHFFRPYDGAEARLLIASSGEPFQGLGLFDLEGRLVWEAASSRPPGTFRFADVDGDGQTEIVSFFDGGLAIHRSEDGQCLARGAIPGPGPFDQNRERPTIHQVYPAALGGPERFDRMVVFDQLGSAGGWTFWVLDADLRVLWQRTVELPPMGHNLSIHDVNGDGREEILAGYHCYSGDGDLLWRVEAARYWDIVQGARHPDSVVTGELWPGTMRAAYAGGGEGFILVDATCGEVIAHHRIGHAQGVVAGRFSAHVPGHQILVGNRHESYGILTIFDGEGHEIGRFQPDYVSQGGPPVNWSGDGTELILLSTSDRAFGLWDLHGRKVVDLSRLEGLDGCAVDTLTVAAPTDVIGDPRDELAILQGTRLCVYTQDRSWAGNRIYAPIRNERIISPATSFERWLPHPSATTGRPVP